MKEASQNERRSDFIRYLDRHREDRGFMADLRCALIPALEQRCWPLLAQFNALTNLRQRTIYSLVAAAYGIQPEAPAEHDNFGVTVRQLSFANGEKASQTFDNGFRKLLDCREVSELASQLPRFFKAAKQKGIPIDHQQLFDDLLYWDNSNQARLRWAQSYFERNRESEGD